jgi:hypothetical protein
MRCGLEGDGPLAVKQLRHFSRIVTSARSSPSEAAERGLRTAGSGFITMIKVTMLAA